MRIDSLGNVGIGTTTPAGKLDVFGFSTAYPGATVTAGDLVVDTANRVVYVGRQSNTAGDNSSFIVRNRTGGPSFTVDVNNDKSYFSSGNVGIGTTTPAYKLDVSGDIRATGTIYGASGTQVPVGTGTENYLSKWSASGTLGDSVLYDDGTNVGIGTTGPAEKLAVDSGNILLNNTYGLRIKNTSGSPVSVITYNGSNETVLGGNSEINLKGSITLQPPGAGDTVINIDSDTDLKVGSNNLWVVGSSGNVGIGNTSPGSLLDVNGTAQLRGASGGTGLYVNSSSNVGIGTTGPGQKLDIQGNPANGGFVGSQILDTGLNRGLLVGVYKATNGAYDLAGLWPATVIPGTDNYIFGTTGAAAETYFNTPAGVGMNFQVAAVTKMYLNSAGNVGIGTTGPAELLDVNGRVRLAQTTAPETTTDRLYNVSGNLL
jgi:hypothetical protein